MIPKLEYLIQKKPTNSDVHLHSFLTPDVETAGGFQKETYGHGGIHFESQCSILWKLIQEGLCKLKTSLSYTGRSWLKQQEKKGNMSRQAWWGVQIYNHSIAWKIVCDSSSKSGIRLCFSDHIKSTYREFQAHLTIAYVHPTSPWLAILNSCHLLVNLISSVFLPSHLSHTLIISKRIPFITLSRNISIINPKRKRPF